MADFFNVSGYSSSSNIMTCIIADNCDIYQVDCLGNRQLIGKTQSAYNELETTTKEYYDKLVELGVITPPKTQEQMMSEMQQVICELINEVKELKSRECAEHSECSEQPVSECKSKRGNTKGSADDQRDD